MAETGSAAGTGPDEEDPARSADRKGGPGHTVLLAVALAVPVTKVAYTVGGGAAARDVFIGMEPANWPDVLDRHGPHRPAPSPPYWPSSSPASSSPCSRRAAPSLWGAASCGHSSEWR